MENMKVLGKNMIEETTSEGSQSDNGTDGTYDPQPYCSEKYETSKGKEDGGSRKRKANCSVKFNKLVVVGPKRRRRRMRCLKKEEGSEGGRVKQLGIVMKRRNEVYGKKQTNVNCRVETFGRVVAFFNETKKDIVKLLGFGNLLNLVDMMLPRNLCYWLMTRVDPERSMFVGSDGIEFPLEPVQIYWVLGTPDGRRTVPTIATVDTLMGAKVQDLLDKYGVRKQNRGNPVIPIQRVIDILEREVDSEEGREEFMKAFLMFALATILCPTTCTNVGAHILPAATMSEGCAEYDWCSFIFDNFIESAKSFHRRFREKGVVSGCGGCTIFLAIFYLDRLNRKPVSWGTWPRIKAWSHDDIRKAQEEDQHGRGGDFGKLGTIDVAYGDGRHPKQARDTKPHKVCGTTDVALAYQVERLLSPTLDRLNKLLTSVDPSIVVDAAVVPSSSRSFEEAPTNVTVMRHKRGRTNTKNPNEWRKEKAARHDASKLEDETCVNSQQLLPLLANKCGSDIGGGLLSGYLNLETRGEEMKKHAGDYVVEELSYVHEECNEEHNDLCLDDFVHMEEKTTNECDKVHIECLVDARDEGDEKDEVSGTGSSLCSKLDKEVDNVVDGVCEEEVVGDVFSGVGVNVEFTHVNVDDKSLTDLVTKVVHEYGDVDLHASFTQLEGSSECRKKVVRHWPVESSLPQKEHASEHTSTMSK